MFSEQGYEGMSLRALGARVGVSHNLVSARFGPKEELWKRAVASRIALRVPPIESAFEEPAESEQARLRLLILRYTQLASQDRSLANMVAIEAGQDTWRMNYILENYVRHFYVKLEQLLVRVGQESGTRPMPPSPFIMLMVQGIGAFFGGMPLLRKLEQHGESDKLSAEAHAEVFAEILLPRLVGSAASTDTA
jgi:AcrR family transcriptional regulator